MSLIVDASACHLFFDPTCKDFRYLYSLLQGLGKTDKFYVVLTTGGLNLKELTHSTTIELELLKLSSAGRVIRLPEGVIEKASQEVSATGIMSSDDPHILGLALASGARLLVTFDNDLSRDFTNGKILKQPGKVYRNRTHDHLIARWCPR